MSQALVVVSFGTKYKTVREKTLDLIKKDLQTAYPDYDCFEAFTSSIIRKILISSGQYVPGPEELFEKLSQSQYQDLLVVPTHLLKGKEYEKIAKAVGKFKNRFHNIILIDPILSSEEDLVQIKEYLLKVFKPIYDEKNNFVLFMGHGSESKAGEMYCKLNELIEDSGVKNVYIACVEGDPDFSEGLEKIEKSHSSFIHLYPLMIVAGEHALNDMSGDENSWEAHLREKGYSVTSHLKGLGEYKWFRDFLVERTYGS